MLDLLVGFGSKGLYADFTRVKLKLDDIVSSMNNHFGVGKWMIVFGGDTYNAMKPDVAALVKYLQDVHQIVVCAVQADVVSSSRKYSAVASRELVMS